MYAQSNTTPRRSPLRKKTSTRLYYNASLLKKPPIMLFRQSWSTSRKSWKMRSPRNNNSSVFTSLAKSRRSEVVGVRRRAVAVAGQYISLSPRSEAYLLQRKADGKSAVEDHARLSNSEVVNVGEDKAKSAMLVENYTTRAPTQLSNLSHRSLPLD